MIGVAVLLAAFVILGILVSNEDARSARRSSSLWRIVVFLLALSGVTVFLFGVALLGIMIFVPPPRGPEGHFPTFLMGTACAALGSAIAGLIVLPSRTVFGKRAARLSDRKSTRLNSSHVSESRMPS